MREAAPIQYLTGRLIGSAGAEAYPIAHIDQIGYDREQRVRWRLRYAVAPVKRRHLIMLRTYARRAGQAQVRSRNGYPAILCGGDRQRICARIKTSALAQRACDATVKRQRAVHHQQDVVETASLDPVGSEISGPRDKDRKRTRLNSSH